MRMICLQYLYLASICLFPVMSHSGVQVVFDIGKFLDRILRLEKTVTGMSAKLEDTQSKMTALNKKLGKVNSALKVIKVTSTTADKAHAAELASLRKELSSTKLVYKENSQRLEKLEGQFLKFNSTENRGCSSVPSGLPDGLYSIKGLDGKMLNVWCDMTTDGGHWLVIQRRKDGTVNFDQTWNNYKSGFGDKAGEFWLGNEVIHGLTSQRPYELRIDMVDKNGVSRYAKYKQFRVGSEVAQYALYLKGYTGNAGDSLSLNSGKKFTTRDRDNDPHTLLNCATYTKGGWWFQTCGHSCLNGMYRNDGSQRGVFWSSWHGFGYSLPRTEIKIRVR